MWSILNRKVPVNPNHFIAPLFDADGYLRADAFEPSAYQLLEATQAWLETIGRTMYLPIDLLLVLIQQREPSICSTIQQIVHGQEELAGIEEQLMQLARDIDPGEAGKPLLNVANFSLGFSGILSDGWAWSEEAKRPLMNYQDIVRAVRWRAEVQDSASIRWATRKLVQPSSDRIFDSSGLLFEPLFSRQAMRYLTEGMHLSVRSGLPFLGTPHLIAAVCSNRRSYLWRAAQSAAIDPLHVRDELLRIVGKHEPALPPFTLSRRTLTPRVVRILLVAHGQAKNSGRLLEEADLLMAFLEDGGSSLELLKALGVATRLQDRLMQRPTASVRTVSPFKGKAPAFPTGMEKKEEAPALESIGTDLIEEARAGRLSPVLGRDEELEHIIRVLMRTEQRNPILTGPPGVGKTALAHALACAIYAGEVPDMLKKLRVVEVHGAALMGGTSFRGELEERITRLLKEAEENVVLFMDEAHAIFAPTSAGGRPAEVPNHFKAALASGRIAVIAATTDSEYQRWFEQDGALARRFERVRIAELPTVVTRRILIDLRKDWSKRYGVEISDDAVDAAVELSRRFLPEQSQPDKAKKLLMDATIATAVAISRRGRPQSTPQDDDNEGQASTRTQQLELLGPPTLTRQHIGETLSLKTGIPLGRILRERSDWWRELRTRLNERVPGRHRVSTQIAEHMLAQRVSTRSADMHAHTMIFEGPSSPAKERFARALVEEVFGTANAFLKLDMSDYQDPHSISRLLGSPPGYVGYNDEDALISPLRRRPGQVVYLADFDRAHPNIRDRLLRMIDDGEITGMQGMRADCTHAVFILSVNTNEQGGSIGFNEADSTALALSGLPKPLRDRVQRGVMQMVSFDEMQEDDWDISARQVFEDELERIRADFRDVYGKHLQLSDERLRALQASAHACHDGPAVRLLLQTELTRPAIQAMLNHERDADGLSLTPEEDAAESTPPPSPPSNDVNEAIRADS